MVEEVSVAVTLDHGAKNTLKVTVVGNQGTEGRKSIQRRGNRKSKSLSV